MTTEQTSSEGGEGLVSAWLDDDEALRIPDTEWGRALYNELRSSADRLAAVQAEVFRLTIDRDQWMEVAHDGAFQQFRAESAEAEREAWAAAADKAAEIAQSAIAERDVLRGRLAAVEALADEWDAAVFTLPPGYPMTVNEFCRLWFKAPLRAALASPSADQSEA